MPGRTYHPQHHPPTNLDHTLAHPWEVPLAVFQLVAGVYGAVAVFVPGMTLGPSVAALPMILTAALSVFLVASGIFILVGLYGDGDDLLADYRNERTGLVTTTAVWGVWGILVAWLAPASVLAYGLGFTFCTGGILRLLATYHDERRLRRTTEEAADE